MGNIHIRVHTETKPKQWKKKKVEEIDPVSKGEQKWYQLVINKSDWKCKLENKTKAMCQLGNKTTKAKQTNKHSEDKWEKEKKKKKERLEKQI